MNVLLKIVLLFRILVFRTTLEPNTGELTIVQLVQNLSKKEFDLLEFGMLNILHLLVL